MDQVQEIKQKTDIVNIIGQRVKLTKAGRNMRGLCPFHDEKTPSFMVSPELQMYKCFGCGEGGDVYEFLQKYERMEFYEALKFLAEQTGVKLKDYKNDKQGTLKEQLKEINLAACKFYQFMLTQHASGKGAFNYLINERGINKKAIDFFGLGYSPEKPGVLYNYLKNKKKFAPNLLKLSGLFFDAKSTISDRFRGRIVFPIFDHRGEIVGFAGRVLPGSSSKMGKYINSPETPLYKKSYLLYGLNWARDYIRKEGFLLVTEGELDMISSFTAGVKNVVASKGTALTAEQMDLGKRFADNIVLALDSDSAGVEATIRAAQIAHNKGLDLSVATMGRYKDPDEFARTDPEKFKTAVSNPEDIWKFIIEYKIKEAQSKNLPVGTLSRIAIGILKQIPDQIVRAHYVKLVADMLEVDPEDVTNQLGGEEVTLTTSPDEHREKENRQMMLENRLLTLAFQHDRSVLINKSVKKLLKSNLSRRIIDEHEKVDKEIEIAEFSAKLPEELRDGLNRIFLSDLGEVTETKSKIDKEINKVLLELRLLDLKQKRDVLSKKIKTAEEKKQKSTIKQLLGEMSDINLQIAELEESG